MNTYKGKPLQAVMKDALWELTKRFVDELGISYTEANKRVRHHRFALETYLLGLIQDGKLKGKWIWDKDFDIPEVCKDYKGEFIVQGPVNLERFLKCGTDSERDEIEYVKKRAESV